MGKKEVETRLAELEAVVFGPGYEGQSLAYLRRRVDRCEAASTKKTAPPGSDWERLMDLAPRIERDEWKARAERAEAKLAQARQFFTPAGDK